MERRWVLFFILSFLIIQIFMLVEEARHPRRRSSERIATTEEHTTAPLVASAETTAALELAQTAPQKQERAALGLNRTVESTSLTIALHPGEITTVTTEKYAMGIDHVGAVVNSWRLLDPGSQSFSRRLEEGEGIELVRRIPQKDPEMPVFQNWPLEISFQERSAFSYEDFNAVPWEVRRTSETVGKRNLVVECLSPSIRGVRVKKALILPQNEYFSTLRVTLVNETSSTISITDENGRGLLLRWGPGLVERSIGQPDPNVGYDAAVYRKDGAVYAMHPVPEKEPLAADGRIEWAGVESKFFTALIVPEQPDDAARKKIYYVRSLVPARHNPEIKGFIPPLTLELATTKFDVPPLSEVALEYGLYVGPKKYEILKKYGASLESVVFHNSYAVMRALYLFLTDVLNWIYALVGNYGVAIIVLTILVRILLFPLAQHSLRINAKTMAEQAKIKPYIDAINEKYKNNPQEKNRQIWKVYQEHGISPFAPLRGCFPLLLQLPIFFGLYRVCNDTIDLQGAHFLWIKDLSQPDHLFSLGFVVPFFGWTHFNLLPILMALTQLLATKVSMARVKVQDPTQKQIMYMMPAIMGVMLYTMPSGLMVYWNVSNVWQIFQTIYTNAVMAREEQQRQATGQVVSMPAAPAQKPKRKKK
ncbi:MAG: membrane protein insertase YidC [Candidatus Sumerlaeaceae bacterium]|nr:membrane protein insertase YidC [Candidatus Sumerlaeaceae bacterium]